MSLYQLIKSDKLLDFQKMMLYNARNCLVSQTETWHINSPKKVACCIYIKRYDDYITTQNIGISNVTGSLCAERSAISVAVAKFSDLSFNDITDLCVIGESNPLLPCGVCCEWLYKINPNMNLYTLKNDMLMKINISDYYGDEATIERRNNKG